MYKGITKVLGIETSCDNSCISIMDVDGTILFSRNINQEEWLKEDGGYIPMLLGERHISALSSMLKELREIFHTIGFDAVAITVGPGLMFSLMVGHAFATSLSVLFDRPIYYINHIEGHILSPLLQYQARFPFISIVATGGHFLIVEVEKSEKQPYIYRLLCETLDDAPGEVLDKFARLLNLEEYTGRGVEKCAEGGGLIYSLSSTYLRMKDVENISFSGIKTRFCRAFHSNKYSKADLCFTIQHVICMLIYNRVVKAVRQKENYTIYLTGGVAANRYINNVFLQGEKDRGYRFYPLNLIFCTDNAEMIANVFIQYHKAQSVHLLSQSHIYTNLDESTLFRYP